MAETQPTINISFTRANGTQVSIAGSISDAVLEEIAATLTAALVDQVTEPTPAP